MSLVTWTLLSVGFAGVRVYALQAKVDSMQQDIVSLSLTMVALRSDLDQRASAQNVSRLETDSAKLQQDVTALQGEVAQKASVRSVAQLQAQVDASLQNLSRLEVDVTALQGEVAQKASVRSVAQLQAQVDASLQNLSRLEVVVRGKASLGDVTKKANETTVVTVQAQLAAAEARLRQKADAASTPRFADLPVTPNFLQDTKHFHGICHGRVGVETPWADAWGSPWSFENGAARCR